jgi:type IV pilus assembly protein PilM
VGGVAVESVREIRIPAGIILDGAVEDRKEFAKTVRLALAEEGVLSLNAAISIPTHSATLRWVSLPQLGEEEHRVAAAFKVKKHLPYPIDDAYLSTSPVQVMNEDGIGDSLVISVPRHIISTRALAVERAGLRPVAAELEAQALLRIVERNLGHRNSLLRDASMTIVDIGGTNTEMYVVQNQKLQFIRSVRFGTARIAHVVADEMGVSEALGHKMLANPLGKLDLDGMLSLPYEGQTVKVKIRDQVDMLVKEISRLMRYFRSLHAERSYAGILDHMMLCGGLANLAGLPEYLAAQLRVRIEPIEPFAGMTLNIDNRAFELASHNQNSFAIAVGLALSQIVTNEQEEIADVNHDFAWARSA